MDGTSAALPFHLPRSPPPSAPSSIYASMSLTSPPHQSSVPVPISSSTNIHRTQQSVSSLNGVRTKRSSSHLSWASRTASTSRASDDDSKTSVRVVVRVRPLLQASDPGFDLIPQRFQAPVVQVQSSTALAVDSVAPQGVGAGPSATPGGSIGGRKLFVFDRVFEPSVDQEGVWDYLSESVNNFVDGYNVSIMAYGQSGSGKSYTMGTTGKLDQEDIQRMSEFGPRSNQKSSGRKAVTESIGIVPRAAYALFERLNGLNGVTPATVVTNRTSTQALRTPKRYSIAAPQSFSGSPSRSNHPDRNWQLYATYVEIYNEQLRDLLLSDSQAGPAGRPSLSIREDTRGRIILTGLRQVAINSIEDLLEVLNSGSSIRHTDSTAVNEKSSRSHAIFSLNLTQKKSSAAAPSSLQDKRFSVPLESVLSQDNGSVTAIESKLHFVDLAGSERLKNTGAQGDRAREGISINVGLATLGKVISQLSKHPNAHVSYRDSKLTRLLQDSLGGNAITYMIACVNPVEFHISETLNTLQYAQRARAIQSKPTIQQTFDDRDKQVIIDRLRAEVTFLRDQIRLAEGPHGRRPLAGGLSGMAPIFTNTGVGRSDSQVRETELRTQILDLQENYSALSQRHAKLISELTKARDAGDAAEMLSAATSVASSAQIDRFKQTPSFSEAIEQVVLEYEKTIQSLESSLSTTRASLASAESTVLEKETKMAYLEATNQKLQARVQKAMDRESNDERYLQELEMRVEGASTHEEKNSAVIDALKKELARTRESESSGEEYISTLEERLAEAEQDTEIMQREIARLENVIERERSIGKLDSLLHELDRGVSTPTEQLASIDSSNDSDSSSSTPFPPLIGDHTLSNDDLIASGDESPIEGRSSLKQLRASALNSDLNRSPVKKLVTPTPSLHSISMSINDVTNADLENLYDDNDDDYVVIHGMTLREQKNYYRQNFAEMVDKYQRAMARVSDLEGSTRSKPSSTILEEGSTLGPSALPDGRVSVSSDFQGLSEDSTIVQDDDYSDSKGSSQTVDVEPSFALEALMAPTHRHKRQLRSLNRLSVDTHSELYDARPLARRAHSTDEKSLGLLTLTSTSMKSPFSVSTPSGLSRRPTLPVVDELASPADEDTEDEADTSTALELLRQRYGQLKSQHEVTIGQVETLKSELHRTHLAVSSGISITPSTPLQFSPSTSAFTTSPGGHVIRRMSSQMLSSTDRPQYVIHQLQHRLENDFKVDRNILAVVESELQKVMLDLQMRTERVSGLESELMALKQQISQKSSIITGLTRERSSLQATSSSPLDKSLLSILQEEIVAKEKLMQAQAAIVSELQDQVSSLTARLGVTDKTTVENEADVPSEAVPVGGEQERNLESEISNSTVETLSSLRTQHAASITELEAAHAVLIDQLSQRHSATQALTDREIDAHKSLVSNLESQLREHKSLVEKHETSLRALTDSQDAQTQEFTARLDSLCQRETEMQIRLGETEKAQAKAQAELENSRDRISSLLLRLYTALGRTGDVKDLDADFDALVSELVESRSKADKALEELTHTHENTLTELERIRKQERVNSKLVEELEEQLNTNYNRQMDKQNHPESSPAHEAELQAAKARITSLESRLVNENKSTSDASGATSDKGLRRATSYISLPSSPPPSIPLPPLPAGGFMAQNDPLAESTLPPSPSVDSGSASPTAAATAAATYATEITKQGQTIDDLEGRLRTLEKHLFAEKQLTATLEEALTDLETSSTRLRGEMDSWRRKCLQLEEELATMRHERNESRLSVQQLEEEQRSARDRIERERANLQARMHQLEGAKGGKNRARMGGLNCF